MILFCLLWSMIGFYFWIAFLQKKGWTQPIRKELPADHQNKKGTPLMAGALFVTIPFIVMVTRFTEMSVLLTLIFVSFAAIGYLDDWWKASKQDPGGIKGRTKLYFQFLSAGVCLIWVMVRILPDFNIEVWKNGILLFPAIIYFIVMLVFIVGSANAINFTDGMDGLLSVVAMPTYLFFASHTYNADIRLFCYGMIASLGAFLLYNRYPAKAFMGDTGSLAIGASLSFLAVIEKCEIVVPILFIVYFAEQLSVILQVFWFKRTGKRIFKMSPIHYHFGLTYGWSENKIVVVFGIVSWVAAAVCTLYIKICF